MYVEIIINIGFICTYTIVYILVAILYDYHCHGLIYSNLFWDGSNKVATLGAAPDGMEDNMTYIEN